MLDAGLAKFVHVLLLDSRQIEKAGFIYPTALGHHLAELGKVEQGVEIALFCCDIDECLYKSNHVF